LLRIPLFQLVGALEEEEEIAYNSPTHLVLDVLSQQEPWISDLLYDLNVKFKTVSNSTTYFISHLYEVLQSHVSNGIRIWLSDALVFVE